MSYEKIYETLNKCNCGKGVFVTEEWENDWGTRRQEMRIDCPTCKENHYIKNGEIRRRYLKEEKIIELKQKTKKYHIGKAPF